MAMHPENSGSEKKILVEVEHTTNGAGTPGGTEENQTGEGQVENGRTIEENRSDEFRTDLGDDTDGISPRLIVEVLYRIPSELHITGGKLEIIDDILMENVESLHLKNGHRHQRKHQKIQKR
ncbi:hypothetical protein V8G54_007179 [Vigna mungo]|uniref:Uncharacterized protein n=1 Tax=Vigna mungo TaxID=3915 RepID=A0AAQ3P3C0_VIGMU